MAKQDIRLDVGFFDHPKTRKLKRIIGDTGIIALLRLWAFAAIYRPDGDLSGYDWKEIADAAGWRGRTEKLIEALIEARFLESTPDRRVKLHDWSDHQPWVVHAADRSSRAKKAAEKRWSRKDGCGEHNSAHTDSNAKCNAKCNAPTPTPTPTPNPKRSSSPDGDGYSLEFLDFWKACPKKVGKGAAWRAWQKAKNRPNTAELVVAIEQYKQNIQDRKQRGEFAPEYCHPATWLNERRWEDEIEVVPENAPVILPYGDDTSELRRLARGDNK